VLLRYGGFSGGHCCLAALHAKQIIPVSIAGPVVPLRID
jgi:hypothetical protein